MNRNFNVCKMYNVIIAVIEWYNIETNYMDIKSLLLLQTIVLNSANADFLFGKNENVQKLENSWWRELHFEFHNVSQKLLGKLWCFHSRRKMLRIELITMAENDKIVHDKVTKSTEFTLWCCVMFHFSIHQTSSNIEKLILSLDSL